VTWRAAGVAAVVLGLLTACGGSSSSGEATEDEGPLRLLTHSDFPLDDSVVAELEAAAGEPVVVVVEEDQASMLDLLTASSAGSGIDVVVGLDSLSVGIALSAGLFDQYAPAGVEHLDPTLRVEGDPVVPVSSTDVCFNYDRSWFRPPEEAADEEGVPATPVAPEDQDEVLDAADVINQGGQLGAPTTVAGDDATDDGAAAPDEDEGETGSDDDGDGTGAVEELAARPAAPSSLEALASEEYAGLVAFPDPGEDRLALAFVAGLGAQTAGPPEPGVPDPELVNRLRDLRANDLRVTPSFRDAYFGEFTAGAADGQRPVVLASALMPAVTARFLDPIPPVLQTAVIPDGCTRLVSYAGVLADSARPETARRLLDAIVAPEFQFAMSDARGSRPARTDLIRRPEVAAFDPSVEPLLLDPATSAERVPDMLLAWLTAATPTAEEAGSDATSTTAEE
jgi:ABC-type thiamine transport system substrate-binding protein